MADSAFRVKLPTATTPVFFETPSQVPNLVEDETSNMLVIPISQEIASDFALIGYDTTIRRMEEVLTQQGKQRSVLLYGDNGVGKEHPYSLIVPTPLGNKRWGDLRAGDYLFGTNGIPTKITARHEQGVKRIYRIVFDDETSTLAGLDHLWRVRGWLNHTKREDVPWETLTTQELIDRGIKRKNSSITETRQWELPEIKAVQYNTQTVPLDPYTLGVWIGDGSAGSSRYHKPDVEIVERIRTLYHVEQHSSGIEEGKCPCWYISGITLALKKLDLFERRSYERFIPDVYLHNDVKVRMELLQGLLDTDGTVTDTGTVQFSSSSKKLANHVAWLVRSLGGKATTTIKEDCGYMNESGDFVVCRDSHVVTITMFDNSCIFYLPRKKEKARQTTESRYLIRWIDRIEYDHDEQAMCVTVDATDHLYLVNDFIPTHNTAIIHGLVQRKNRNDLSTHMFKRMFYRLNTSRLLHTDDVAEINKQFDQALQELGHYDVLVIENFYTLVTYLRIKGANVVLIGLLEALSRRKLQAIITCTSRERNLIINEVPEIHEYFAPEKLPEPNNDELLNILRGVHRSYEARYSIAITDDAICAIRDLTQKYRNGMEGWSQPGRALILLDRAIAQFSVRMNSKPAELSDLENQAEAINNEIESLTPKEGESCQEDIDRRKLLAEKSAGIQPKITNLRNQWEETTAPIRKFLTDKALIERKHHDYVRQRQSLVDIRSDNAALMAKNTDPTTVTTQIAELDKMISLANKEIARIDDEMSKINLSEHRDHIVTADHIAQTFSELSGISTKQLTENEKERVLHMEDILAERVYGQIEAITAVSDAVRRAKAHLSDDEGTPKGSFLFLGPSGVGKTELGKALAEFDTGSEKNLIRFDMSEYMEKHSVARLIGAPPGYAGHEEGGTLTNAVSAKPKSVVMFDEIEKAHPDIFKIFLQVLGDGRLTDGQGNTVDFRETYIVLTSNAGTRHFLNDELTYDEAARLALGDVDQFLLPEIRGRLDSIICFRRLELPLLVKVATKRIKAINHSIETHKLSVDISPEDIEKFCIAYRDNRYGARAILKSLKKTLEKDLAMAVLSSSNNGVLNAAFDAGVFKIDYVPATS